MWFLGVLCYFHLHGLMLRYFLCIICLAGLGGVADACDQAEGADADCHDSTDRNQ
jgi:hypothetical protein